MKPAIDVPNSRSYYGKLWVFERVGWAVIFLLVAASTAGLTGDGPLSRTSEGSPGFEVEYERVARLNAPTRMHFVLHPAERPVRLSIGREYLESVDIDHWVPEPSRVDVESDRVVYTFDLGAASGEVRIEMHAKPHEFGRFHVHAATARRPPVEFHQLILP